ncbi:MAG: ARMT1-like domain-containing protein [Thermodesulfovibrionales bacterium]
MNSVKPADGKPFRVDPECYPCFLRQAVIALEACASEEALRHRVMKAVLQDMERMDTARSPAHATTSMHRTIRRMTCPDPFGGIKRQYNEKALALYPGLRDLSLRSPEPLLTAARLAIAGNAIDFGIYRSVDVEAAVKRALEEPLAVDGSGEFLEAVGRARDILFLLDNAGEAVFDRILMEVLAMGGKRVTAVAKGSPVINDCTVEDARQAGVDAAAALVDNGSDAVGTILETTSPAFRERFAASDLIISKGQGNFETLMDRPENIFFLFQSKCKVLSRFLGLEPGSMLLVGPGGRG